MQREGGTGEAGEIESDQERRAKADRIRSAPAPARARKTFTTPPTLAPLGLLWYLAPVERGTGTRICVGLLPPKICVCERAPELNFGLRAGLS